ncbi:hypothetical protein AVEN_174813-1 [Araneus ventricosus]|uniref:Uncharacterized protein n=1 Tax=Araneus ventricosus TaxID=182803 RepID=A0A4Y2P0Y4_ARAVE|nr:hypothetical protein AVEN_174813-1 [Araneus ventricosus]
MERSIAYPRGKEGKAKNSKGRKTSKEDKAPGYLGVVNLDKPGEDIADTIDARRISMFAGLTSLPWRLAQFLAEPRQHYVTAARNRASEKPAKSGNLPLNSVYRRDRRVIRAVRMPEVLSSPPDIARGVAASASLSFTAGRRVCAPFASVCPRQTAATSPRRCARYRHALMMPPPAQHAASYSVFWFCVVLRVLTPRHYAYAHDVRRVCRRSRNTPRWHMIDKTLPKPESLYQFRVTLHTEESLFLPSQSGYWSLQSSYRHRRDLEHHSTRVPNLITIKFPILIRLIIDF